MSACPESVPNPTLDRAEALEAELLELTAHIHAGEYRQLELIAQFDENGCFGWGVRSCAHWMNWRLGISMGAAREKVRVARALQKLPLIKEAFRKGKVSYSKVRAMTRVANKRNQTFLLQIARYGTASHMERLISHYRKFKSRVGLHTANEQYALRELHYLWDDDGSLIIRGRLPAEVGTVVVKAIETAWDMAFQERSQSDQDEEEDNNEKDVSAGASREKAVGVSAETYFAESDGDVVISDSGCGDSGMFESQDNVVAETTEKVSAGTLFEVINGGLNDTKPKLDSWDETHKGVSAGIFWKKPLRFRRRDKRGQEGLSEDSFAAGRADALAMLCERFLAQSARTSGSVDPYQVYVHVDPDTLRGGDGDHSHIESGPELNAETARRICCDTGLIPVTENKHGEILNVGRKTRTIPPALKRALRLRDKGCRFPGCTQFRHTDAHHIQHWADGGETKLSNLITLCRYHHRLMHEGGATLTMDNRREPKFDIPDLGYMSLCA